MEVCAVSEKIIREGRVFSSVRKTTLFLLKGIVITICIMCSFMLNEKLSTQNTMKAYQAARKCFTSLRIKLFLLYYRIENFRKVVYG